MRVMVRVYYERGRALDWLRSRNQPVVLSLCERESCVVDDLCSSRHGAECNADLDFSSFFIS